MKMQSDPLSIAIYIGVLTTVIAIIGLICFYIWTVIFYGSGSHGGKRPKKYKQKKGKKVI